MREECKADMSIRTLLFWQFLIRFVLPSLSPNSIVWQDVTEILIGIRRLGTERINGSLLKVQQRKFIVVYNIGVVIGTYHKLRRCVPSPGVEHLSFSVKTITHAFSFLNI